MNKKNGEIEQLGKRSVANHPNIKRWNGYLEAYMNYIDAHLWIWDNSYGFKEDSINIKNIQMLCEETGIYPLNQHLVPKWITDDLIKENQQILLKKDYIYYSKYFKEIK